MIKRFHRADRALRKTRRLGRCIRIKRRAFYISASGPKSRADHFMRIRFPRNRIRSRPLRCASPRKARRRQVKAAPEKVHRAGFSDEPRAKLFEHGLAAYQNPPE